MKIRLKGFRGFAEEGVTVDLQRMTVLTGKNSSGKSTVLRVLELLRGLRYEQRKNIGQVKFNLASDAYGGSGAFLNHNSEVECSIEFFIFDNFFLDRLSVRIVFEKNNNALSIRRIEVLGRESRRLMYAAADDLDCFYIPEINRLHNELTDVYTELGAKYFNAQSGLEGPMAAFDAVRLAMDEGLSEANGKHWYKNILTGYWAYGENSIHRLDKRSRLNAVEYAEDIRAGKAKQPPLKQPFHNGLLGFEDFFGSDRFGDALYDCLDQNAIPNKQRQMVRRACQAIPYHTYNWIVSNRLRFCEPGDPDARQIDRVTESKLKKLDYLQFNSVVDRIDLGNDLHDYIVDVSYQAMEEHIADSTEIGPRNDLHLVFERVYGFNESSLLVIDRVMKWVNQLNFHAPKNVVAKRAYDIFDTRSAVAAFFQKFSNSSDETAVTMENAVTRHLNVLGIHDNLKIKTVDNTGYIRFQHGTIVTTLADEGVGVANILSIVMFVVTELLEKMITPSNVFPEHDLSSLFYEPRDGAIDKLCIVLEEPETGLHPSLQSRLADYLVMLIKKYDCSFIIETHSEYFIRKLQLLIAKDEIPHTAVALNYFQNEAEVGKSITAYQINIDEHGILDRPFGPGFFDEADNLAVELFNINRNKLN